MERLEHGGVPQTGFCGEAFMIRGTDRRSCRSLERFRKTATTGPRGAESQGSGRAGRVQSGLATST
jgi:hypothetical protein